MSSVLVEVNARKLKDSDPKTIESALQRNAPLFRLDHDYPTIPMQDAGQNVSSYLVKGEVPENGVKKLKESEIVLEVFNDTPIAPF